MRWHVENIGNKLRERREELGLSIEDVSAKTRLTIKHIKAIEAGDISYFKDDLSYLRFFLRSYCSVLDMDFDEIKEDLHNSIDDYTESFSVEMMRQHREIEKNVKRHSDTAVKPTMHKKERTRRNRHKIDMSMLSFIIIVLIVIACLIYAFYMFVIKGDKTEKPAEPTPPISDVTDTPDVPTPPIEETPPEEEVIPFAITRLSDNEYTLENLKEGDAIDIEIVFGSFSQFHLAIDDVSQSEPISKVYNYKDVIHITQSARNGMKISLGFGFMQSNTITINGVAVEFAPAIASSQGAVTLDFIVKGE